ncbi:hypothetical protein ACFS5N_05795 [Mucilaginibacter ximonensis]|uniref:Uncharacterized protein n=1 Tax=Mucilaginibacter ximonensis TaxID=538021 RepID=A0ABW5Y9P9_9SPHI
MSFIRQNSPIIFLCAKAEKGCPLLQPPSFIACARFVVYHAKQKIYFNKYLLTLNFFKMTTNQKSYSDSYRYEAFMKRAHRAERDFSRGIDNSVFRLLNDIDCGYYGKPRDYPKQVIKIKNYLFRAIDKVLKWKLNPDERRAVTFYESQLSVANDENSLADVIAGLLDATQRFVNY